MADLQVLIVADNLLARAGLASLLSTQARLEVVGQVSGESGLADDLEVYGPDVLLWDLGWNPKPGLERLAALMDEISQRPFMLVLIPDEAHAGEAAALLNTAGSGGLLLRVVVPAILPGAELGLSLPLLCQITGGSDGNNAQEQPGLISPDPAPSPPIYPGG
ncbi:MAG: response regulator transcription factor [Rhodospirillales bacterium]|nr:response regulator transcription factor [Rhodospirillales bacterium]